MKALIEISDIKRILKATKGFISKSDERLALQYIRLDFDKETSKLKASALDGFMLSVEFAPLIQIDESFSAYIKPYLPIGTKSDYAEITVKKEFCYINVGDRSVGYKQPDIKWLDTDELIRKEEADKIDFSIYIDSEKLSTILKSIGSKCSDKATTVEFRGECKPIIIRHNDSVRMLAAVRR